MSRERKKKLKFELRYKRTKSVTHFVTKILTLFLTLSIDFGLENAHAYTIHIFERRTADSALCALGQSYAACGRGAGCSHNNQCSSPHQPGWPRSLRSQRPACLALPNWRNHNSRGSAADPCSQVARVPSKAGLARFARSGPPCWWVRAFGPDS